jgi:hypothetical protein
MLLPSNFPELASIKSGLYKNKRKTNPKLPTSIEDLIILDDFTLTMVKDFCCMI